MTEQEKERRKAIWDSMAEKERLAVENERKEIIQWWIDEEKKLREKIIEEGRYIGGLDGDYPEIVALAKEANQKLSDQLKKVFKV